MNQTVSIHFDHGLGDAANFAHLLPLYTRRGFDVEIACTPDKRCLFEAAGARIVPQARSHHSWWHPPAPGKPTLADPWSGNKCAWGVSQAPLPNIGSYADRWQEYTEVRLDLERFVTAEAAAEVERFLADLPRPLICFAPQGNTGQGEKNLPHDQQAEVLRGLLERTDGTLILLDWDNRVHKLPNGRVRHLCDDWKRLDLIELYCLLQRADLLVSVDSGPLHFARFTKVPALGVWTRHHPIAFALPRAQTLNLAPARQSDWTRFRRWPFQIVEYADDRPGAAIVETAVQLLGPRCYLADPFADTLLRSLVAKLAQPAGGSPLTSWYDRQRSFDRFLRHAASLPAPTILETGCMRAEEDWTAGMSSYLLGYFLAQHGGRLHSIDLDAGHVEFARRWTQGMPVEVHHAHSHTWLREYAGTVDLAYLDSADTGTIGYQECCLEEARLVAPKLRPGGLVLIDDTCFHRGQISGKGTLAVPWLREQGFRLLYHGYQALLCKPS